MVDLLAYAGMGRLAMLSSLTRVGLLIDLVHAPVAALTVSYSRICRMVPQSSGGMGAKLERIPNIFPAQDIKRGSMGFFLLFSGVRQISGIVKGILIQDC